MSDNSRIEWTDASWNPVTGCTKVSPGCAHCYAEAITLRFKRGPAFLPGVAEIKLHPDRLDQPLRWRLPRRVFVNSMSDLFHEDVPDDFIDDVFAIMVASQRHTFQVLTKRPERMRDYFAPGQYRDVKIGDKALAYFCPDADMRPRPVLMDPWPAPNVWLGVSVENQYWADRRIPLLLETPAAVRFLSVEPLLKAVTLTDRPHDASLYGGGIHWVIVGGESGPGHRPMNLDWVRSLRDQCVAAGVPFFYKQPGGPRPGGDAVLDGREWREFPEGALHAAV